MSKTFFCADHHFWHHNILTFKTENGIIARDGFKDIEDMNEFIVEQHNAVVSPDDKVYFVGDVVMRNTAKWFEPLSRMNGNKILIKGNHDTAKLNIYQRYFKDFRSSHMLKAFVAKDIFYKVHITHIPIHPESVGKGFNVHGHIHWRDIPDERYINVGMEHLEQYRPIEWEEILNYVKTITKG